MDKKSIITKIKELRKKQGLSQKELAEKVGVGNSYISDVETGRTNASIDQLAKILEILGANIEDFIDNSEKKKSLLEWIRKTKTELSNIEKLIEGM